MLHAVEFGREESRRRQMGSHLFGVVGRRKNHSTTTANTLWGLPKLKGVLSKCRPPLLPKQLSGRSPSQAVDGHGPRQRERFVNVVVLPNLASTLVASEDLTIRPLYVFPWCYCRSMNHFLPHDGFLLELPETFEASSCRDLKIG
jgi:hypothetical protein